MPRSGSGAPPSSTARRVGIARAQRPGGGVGHQVLGPRSAPSRTPDHRRAPTGRAPPDERDGRRRDDRIGLVNELRERVVEIARSGCAGRRWRARTLSAERQVVDDRHHASADGAGEQVVEVLDGARARARRRLPRANGAPRRCPATDGSGPAAGRCGRASRSSLSSSARTTSDAQPASSCAHELNAQRQVVVVAAVSCEHQRVDHGRRHAPAPGARA